MADRHDTTIASEKFGLYGIIIGLIGLATAYVALGLGQLKIFEAYMPFIFIFIGAVYLALSVVLVNSLRAPSQTGISKGGGSSFDIKNLIEGLLSKARIVLSFAHKYKLPIFVLAAFGAGAFLTSMLTSGSSPAFKFDLNFTLPSLQLPSLNKQESSSSAIVALESKKVPTNISSFSASKSDGNYTFSFSVEDKDSAKLNASGNASLKVTDQSNKVLYEENFEAQESDFSESVYSKIVDSSKVGKSTSGSGTATIVFTASGGVVLSSSASIEVPTLSIAELESMSEIEYLNTAISVGKPVTKFAFEVTLVRMGYFNKIEADTTKTYYRVDLKVKNTYAIATEFKTGTAKLIIGGSTYSPDPQSPFKTENIKGGQTRENYLIFKDVPSTITGSIRVRAGTTTANEEIEYIFDVNV